MAIIVTYLMIGALLSLLVPWDELEEDLNEPIQTWMRVVVGAMWPVILVVLCLRIATGR